MELMKRTGAMRGDKNAKKAESLEKVIMRQNTFTFSRGKGMW